MVSDGSVSQTHVKAFLMDVALSRSIGNAELSDVNLTKHVRQSRKVSGSNAKLWCREPNDIEMRLRFVGVRRRKLRLHLCSVPHIYDAIPTPTFSTPQCEPNLRYKEEQAKIYMKHTHTHNKT